jgi:hypothetical protein
MQVNIWNMKAVSLFRFQMGLFHSWSAYCLWSMCRFIVRRVVKKQANYLCHCVYMLDRVTVKFFSVNVRWSLAVDCRFVFGLRCIMTGQVRDTFYCRRGREWGKIRMATQNCTAVFFSLSLLTVGATAQKILAICVLWSFRTNIRRTV